MAKTTTQTPMACRPSVLYTFTMYGKVGRGSETNGGQSWKQGSKVSAFPKSSRDPASLQHGVVTRKKPVIGVGGLPGDHVACRGRTRQEGIHTL